MTIVLRDPKDRTAVEWRCVECSLVAIAVPDARGNGRCPHCCHVERVAPALRFTHAGDENEVWVEEGAR